MTKWRPQPFRTAALADNRDPQVIENAVDTAKIVLNRHPSIEPIFTLQHLARLTGTSYLRLREFVSRDNIDAYRTFKIHKRSLPDQPARFRTIVIPDETLMYVQRWLNFYVLDHIVPHPASTGFSRGDSIYKAAERHCGASWLIKMDLRNFFESVTERQVYGVYRSIGYQPLVSLELARLCTRVSPSHGRLGRYRSKSDYNQIASYRSLTMGHLPQGAPTSPRLANLVARSLDEKLTRLAELRGFQYTRYADDLTFSTHRGSSRSIVKRMVGDISQAIGLAGFEPNQAKTTISPPGTRKIVLGLLVDRDEPRLTREFKAQLRQHLYYLRRFGAAAHAKKQGDATVFGLRNHVLGLIQHARQIEKCYGNERLREFNCIVW